VFGWLIALLDISYVSLKF